MAITRDVICIMFSEVIEAKYVDDRLRTASGVVTSMVEPRVGHP
jgi:hypothetical protein